QYARHGLHAFGRVGRAAASVPRRIGSRQSSQGLLGGSHCPFGRPGGGLRAWTGASLPCLVAPRKSAIVSKLNRNKTMNATALSELEHARFNMVEQQIRPWDVSDERVLQALFDVPRERYVPAPMKGLAFSDVELPLVINSVDTPETMLTPKVDARLAQALLLPPTDGLLELGTGPGYQAARLAKLGQQVTPVEVDSNLAAFGAENLAPNQVNNVTVEPGDAHEGWGTTEYDAILVTGSVPAVPDALKYQLRIGGR